MNGIGSSQPFTGVQQGVAPANGGRLDRTGAGFSPGASAGRLYGDAETTTFSATAGMVVAALSGSDVRMDRVTALQQSIGTGTYNISASDVADKVLSALAN